MTGRLHPFARDPSVPGGLDVALGGVRAEHSSEALERVQG